VSIWGYSLFDLVRELRSNRYQQEWSYHNSAVEFADSLRQMVAVIPAALSATGKPSKRFVSFPLRSAEHFAVMSIFRKATRSFCCFALEWDPLTAQYGSSLVCAGNYS
jgi:hypothetical protein